MEDLRFGKDRYFRPVCLRYSFGFYGGPAEYIEVSEADKDIGMLIFMVGTHDCIGDGSRMGIVDLGACEGASDEKEVRRAYLEKSKS